MANLIKKDKNTKDKLRSTGYGRGCNVSGNDSKKGQHIIRKHLNDMDGIIGKKNQSIHATCSLECQAHIVVFIRTEARKR